MIDYIIEFFYSVVLYLGLEESKIPRPIRILIIFIAFIPIAVLSMILCVKSIANNSMIPFLFLAPFSIICFVLFFLCYRQITK